MIFNRHCLALLVVGCCCTRLGVAEDAPPADSGGASQSTGTGTGTGTGTSPGSGTGTGASQGSGTDTGTSPSPGTGTGTSQGSGTGTGTSPGSGTGTGQGASSSFGSNIFSSGTGGYNSGNPPPFGQDNGTASGAGAASAFSKPSGTSANTTFTLPGFYGQGGRQTLTAGEGTLAKPHFETTFSLSVGYDDNYASAPGGGAPSLAPNGTFSITPGIPAHSPIIKDEVVFLGGLQVIRPVVVGFTGAATPGVATPLFDTIPALQRLGSFLTRANFGFDMQFAAPRSLFTLSATGGSTYYWDKDQDPFENNASLNASFLYKITPRLQTTTQANIAYTTQPDLARLNTPDRPTLKPYFSALVREDLAYRFTPRFSMTGSANYSGLRFTDTAEQTGDSDELTFGLQASYLWNPRYTFVTEYRYSTTSYSNNSTRNSSTDYFLLGVDFHYSSRLDGSVRVGASTRSFDIGGSATSPYFEGSLNYRATSRSVLSWTSRFGFEEPDAPNLERLVLRTGVNYAYSFTPRLRGSLGVNFLNDRTTVVTGGSGSTVELTFDSTAALDYTINQHFSLNLSYSFTDVVSDVALSSFYRDQIFFGGTYHF